MFVTFFLSISKKINKKIKIASSIMKLNNIKRTLILINSKQKIRFIGRKN
jgi:hypothetical protein